MGHLARNNQSEHLRSRCCRIGCQSSFRGASFCELRCWNGVDGYSLYLISVIDELREKEQNRSVVRMISLLFFHGPCDTQIIPMSSSNRFPTTFKGDTFDLQLPAPARLKGWGWARGILSIAPTRSRFPANKPRRGPGPRRKCRHSTDCMVWDRLQYCYERR